MKSACTRSHCCLTAAVAVLVSVSAHAEGVLNVYNWGEYIAEDTIANFEQEFDVKVTYDNYDSVETAHAKLLAGGSGYDVVLHAGSNAAQLIPTGILQELDRSRLPNFSHIRPDIMEQLSSIWDPGNKYVVPYTWGTHGVTYNEALVRATHPEAPIGSMEMVLNPEHMEKLSKCGVAFLDSPDDIMGIAMAHMGLDPNSTSPADYKKAGKMLKQIRPYIKTFDNYAYQRMPEREFCVAITWGPDGLLAMSQAAEAETGVVLDFFLPEGEQKSNLWVDGWIIPKGAKNVDNAHLFLNYMMRPQVAANDSNFTWYATANQDAIPLVDEDVSGNPAAYPKPEQVQRMYTFMVRPPKVERAKNRAWTNFKSGR